jgi:hypothetical protein
VINPANPFVLLKMVTPRRYRELAENSNGE